MQERAYTATERRALILDFLRSRTEPATMQDFTSLTKEISRIVRKDLVALERAGTIRKRKGKGVAGAAGGFRVHLGRFCAWEAAR